MARARIAMLSLIVLITASVGAGDDEPRRVLRISADPNKAARQNKLPVFGDFA